MEVKKDFGDVVLKDFNREDYYVGIETYMSDNGYDVKTHDICSTQKGVVDEKGFEIYFKFVHWKVPTMANQPYYRINFIQENI